MIETLLLGNLFLFIYLILRKIELRDLDKTIWFSLKLDATDSTTNSFLVVGSAMLTVLSLTACSFGLLAYVIYVWVRRAIGKH